jgi:Probable cobalt transporter subunit (CbtB)
MCHVKCASLVADGHCPPARARAQGPDLGPGRVRVTAATCTWMLDAVAGRSAHLPAFVRDERVVGCSYVLVGIALVYLVLFDQGGLLGVAIGSAIGHEDALHELFHDGRHLANAPCH